MHEVLVNGLGGLSLPRKSVVRLTDRPDMTLDVYRGCKTTIQQQQQQIVCKGKLVGEEKSTFFKNTNFPEMHSPERYFFSFFNPLLVKWI